MKTGLTRGLILAAAVLFGSAGTGVAAGVQRWTVFETSWETSTVYANPYTDIEVNVIFEQGGQTWTVPAFWAGAGRWTVRFAPPVVGEFRSRVECTDKENRELNGRWQSLGVTVYSGEKPLLRHGFIRVNTGGRYFEHADGTPFLWLGDTWWKNLCGRMTWDGFRELTADRRAKGFNLVQIVCGPYPDEGMLEPRWANEGGLPYEDINLSRMNPEYFRYADRRLFHLAENGIVPAIVGGWGREQAGGKSTIALAGVDAYKRHWRHLVARYGALPVVWIVGGEAGDWQGPWSEVASYLKSIDPYHHPITYHSPGNPRKMLKDNDMFDFDMIAIGHDGLNTAKGTLDILKSCLNETAVRPALCGEACYEGHMQTNFQDVQRHLFWSLMLSGAAGHTYGAAGIWHASVEGEPGITPVYDYTTWKEGMGYPGSTHLGIGKRLMEQYPWWRFEPHPEWADSNCFAAGITGEIRIIYLPKRNIYNWEGPSIKGLEPDVDWKVFYFDPATGRTFDQGVIKAVAKKGDAGSKPVDFKRNVPSPQDWVLVFKAVD